jgi:hypothetical protein
MRNPRTITIVDHDVSATRCIIDVTAGVLPGHAEPEYGRRWTMSAAQWDEAQRQGPDQCAALLSELSGQAAGWAAYLQLQPERLNWVRTEWVWL